MITCHSTRQSKQCITKQRSTHGRFLKNTRFPQSTRHIRLFHCARWFPCWLWNMFSRLISWRWSKPFTWDIGKVTRFFICFDKLEGQGVGCFSRNGTCDDHWVVENERFEKVLQEDPNLVHFSDKIFLCGTRTTEFRHGCYTYCTMMIHLGTYL